MVIQSTSNERIKRYAKLKQKKYRDEEQLFIVEGIDLVNAALERGVVECIITTSLDYTCNDIEVVYVDRKVIEKLSFTSTPQDIVAVCRFFNNDVNYTSNVMVLDGIQDPSNAGAIARSCLAFGYDTLVLSSDSVDLYNDKFLRSSKGASFMLNVIKGDLKEIYKSLKNKGFVIVGSALENSVNLPLKIENKNIALVVGNEGQGISKVTFQEADHIVKINMSNKMESLNVGVAAAILMYQFSSYSK